jgi:predicted nucleic acid-binding protein
MIVLIDTNILLDFTQTREEHYNAAARLWSLVEHRAVIGYVSAISFNNLFYIARRKDGNRKAFEALRYVRQVFDIVPLDEKII